MRKFICLATMCYAIQFFLPVEVQAQYVGSWRGLIKKSGKDWRVELHIYQENNVTKGWVDYPDYGLYHFLIDSVSLTDSSVQLIRKDKNSAFVFHGKLNGKTFMGNWEGLGQQATFELERKQEKVKRIIEEEVQFTNKDAKLSGTLLIPEGTGPFPAIVQVHGSGNQTRSEDFYRSRGYLLAQNGIAVLLYDRRGRGASTGSAVSMDLLAEDAIAGLRYLQDDKRMIKNKIGVMGFSQAGYIVPLAASTSSEIAFLIAGAAPSITPDQQNDFNVLNRLKRRNIPSDSINYVMEFRKSLSAYQFSGTGNKEKLEEQLNQLRTKSWFQQTLLSGTKVEPMDSESKKWLSFDPLPAWKKVKVPVLLIWGEYDELVPAQKSKEEITSALTQGGNKNLRAEIFLKASHGMAISSNEWDWPRLSPGFHQLLVEWVKRVAD